MIFLKKHYLLIIIIILGSFLRLWGINFGLPYQFHQDEPIIVNHALAYGSGDLNPHFFIIPPLTSYILFFLYGVYFLILKILGMAKNAEVFALSFFRDPAPFYLIGRIFVGVLPSLINIYLTYRLALKIISRKAALYTGLCMSVIFLNVINAHYLYTDSLLVLWMLCAFLAFFSLSGNPTKGSYISAAIFTGLAIATKYNAVILVVPFFITHWQAARRKFKLFDFKPYLNLIIFTAVVILTFIVFNPYSILDWKFFLVSVTGRIRSGYTGWLHHLRYSLFEGMGIYLTLIGIAGLLAFLKEKLKPAAIVISFLIVFWLHLSACSQPFPRYALVLIPFLCIGAAYLLYDFFIPRLKSKSLEVIIIVISLVVLVPALIKSIKADILFSNPDTRQAAALWIKKNIPAQTKIAFDHTFFRPQIKNTTAQLEQKKEILLRQPELAKLKSKKLDLQIKASELEDKTYEIYYIARESENVGQFLEFWPVVENNTVDLKKYNIEYVIFNNMQLSGSIWELHEKIAKKYKLIAEFNPYFQKKFRRSYDEIEITAMPIKSKELFSREKSGPYIAIYKIK